MAKYLLISNKGLLDLTLLRLIGASTKTEDTSKIGQFGTGLKYAISYLLRTGNNFRVFIGDKEVKFSTKKTRPKGGVRFDEIFCNGESMSITTHYGYQWVAWEAIREIWCNALDEVDPLIKVIDRKGAVPAGKRGTTRFFIEIQPDMQEVLDKWDSYFINERKPLFQDDKVAIYKAANPKLCIYKNGTLIENSGWYSSIFDYDFKNCELNELRQYRGYINSDAAEAILNSNREVISHYLTALTSKKPAFEVNDLNFKYAKHTKSKVKSIFQGYVFLHPESDKTSTDRAVKVPIDLYDILQTCGLPCEHIKTSSSGGYYGGGGVGYSNNTLSYKCVQDDRLKRRVNAFLKEFEIESDITVEIGVTMKDKFEVLFDKKTSNLVINSELNVLSDADLFAVIMVGILQRKEANMYAIMKRLIKITMRAKNFRKILFG